VDRLYVKEIFVDGGPMAKRVRPAPMGRAFRVLRRQSHIHDHWDTRKGDGKRSLAERIRLWVRKTHPYGFLLVYNKTWHFALVWRGQLRRHPCTRI